MKLPKLGKPEGFLKNFVTPVFWGVREKKDTEQVVRSLIDRMDSGVFFSDNLLTWCRNNSMLDDPKFIESWSENSKDSVPDQGIIWRRYILACAACHCVQFEGDFVECGCYRGTAVKTIVDYLGGKEFPRTFWAYDLFVHEKTDIHHSMPSHGEDLYEKVKARFDGYPQVNVVKGRVPEIFESRCPEKISYLHIDMNEAPAEMAAITALFDLVVPGGMVILDDYEWSYYRRQKISQDPWFEERDYRVMPLPTGQGLVFKR